MTQSKHSPGPWAVKVDGLQGLHIVGAPEDGPSDRHIIANIATYKGEYEPESTANADLFAAAPDLLEALQECLNQLATKPKGKKHERQNHRNETHRGRDAHLHLRHLPPQN